MGGMAVECMLEEKTLARVVIFAVRTQPWTSNASTLSLLTAFRQICLGVGEACARGMVYCSIRGSNICTDSANLGGGISA